MSFEYSLMILPAILLVIVSSYLILRLEKKYFEWVELYWFFKKRFSFKISTVFFIIGLALLIFTSLDLRGPEQRIEGKSTDQKTIILIDSSASMLAEDVRPNRFEKAILLVKHFVKKAVGQQVSVVVFSDGQKRIVPFTEDIDLIEAKLNALSEMSLERGGTGLSMALQESIQYFKTVQKEPRGNILLLTDGEETVEQLNLEIPDSITVGVVGIGTAKGGPIPKRDRYNNFQGNKKHRGQVVMSKLNENYLKGLGEDIEHYKYWIATSYTLPTEQILNFFNTTKQLKDSKNTFRVRPVYAHFLLVPALLSFLICYLLRLFPIYTLSIMLFLSIGQDYLYAQEKNGNEEPQKSEITMALEEAFKAGVLDKKGRLKLAESLLKDGHSKESEILYSEEIDDSRVTKENIIDNFNYATALAQNQKIKESINKYNEILKVTENEELEKVVKENLKKLFEQSQQQKQNKQDQSKENNNQDQNGEGQGKGQEEQKDNQEGKKEDQKDGQGNKKEEQDKKNNPDEKTDEQKKQEQEKQNGKKKKMPAIVKQLINDDNQLQKKMIDAKTSERARGEKKDW